MAGSASFESELKSVMVLGYEQSLFSERDGRNRVFSCAARLKYSGKDPVDGRKRK